MRDTKLKRTYQTISLFKINEDWEFYRINDERLFPHFSVPYFEQYVRSQMSSMVQRYVYDYLVVPEDEVDVDKYRTSIIIGNSIDINKLKPNFTEVR